MKKTLLLLCLSVFVFNLKAQIVSFADTNFRYRLLHPSGSPKVDLNNNGEIEVSEAEAATTLSVFGSNIKDLKGIEAFKNLTFLACNGNQITSLDLSSNTKLESLACYGNPITSLNINKNTKLKSLDCAFNDLPILDVSNNPDLIEIQCQHNKLKSLDVSHNPELKYFPCSDNLFTQLDLSQNKNVILLNATNNPSLTKICINSEIQQQMILTPRAFNKDSFAEYSFSCQTTLNIDNQEPTLLNTLSASPNPFINKLTINSSGHVKIINLTGHVVFESSSAGEVTIFTENWPCGVYFINSSIIKKKLLKE